MDTYERTSSLTTFAALPPVLREALRERADIEDSQELLLTRSRRTTPQGFLARMFAGGADPDAEHLTVLARLPESVVLAVHGQERGTTAWRLPIGSLVLEDPLSLPGAETGPGVTVVSALLGGHDAAPGSFGLYVGPEPEAGAFVSRLRDGLRG